MKKILLILVLVTTVTSCASGTYNYEHMQSEMPGTKELTKEKQVYTTDETVMVDGVSLEALKIGGETVIALEDLRKCGFNEEHRFEGEAFDMIGKSEGEYDKSEVLPSEKNVLKGTTTPSNDIVRVNGIKISSDLFNGKHYTSIRVLSELDDPYNREWGYSDYNMKLTETGKEKRIECFRFQKEDYEARLAEAEKLSDVIEAELYTEGDVYETTHYNAKYEPQTGVYAGIVGDGNGGRFDGDTPAFDHDFAVYSGYLEFDKKQDELYDLNKYVAQTHDCVMLTPWNIEDITLVFNEDYQDYIKKTLDNLKKYNKPVIVRFGAEMNIGNLGNSPSAYVKAFRRISDLVHSYGFAVMWSPNDMNSLDRDYSYYYPGDKYVDWIGVSCFMRKDFMSKAPTERGDAIVFNCSDYAFHTNSIKRIVKFMDEKGIKKPLAVSEGGVISKAVYEGAPEDFTLWAHERLRNMYWYLPMKFPQIKLITYFNHTTENTLIGYWLKDKPDYIPIIEDALQNGPYLLSGADKADFVFVKASGRDYTNDEIPVYTYLYMPDEGGHVVQYILDGKVIDTARQIPYKTVLRKSDIADGEHILVVAADGNEMRKYTVKRENGHISINEI